MANCLRSRFRERVLTYKVLHSLSFTPVSLLCMNMLEHVCCQTVLFFLRRGAQRLWETIVENIDEPQKSPPRKNQAMNTIECFGSHFQSWPLSAPAMAWIWFPYENSCRCSVPKLLFWWHWEDGKLILWLVSYGLYCFWEVVKLD